MINWRWAQADRLASALFRDRTYNNHHMKKVGTGIKSDISSPSLISTLKYKEN